VHDDLADRRERDMEICAVNAATIVACCQRHWNRLCDRPASHGRDQTGAEYVGHGSVSNREKGARIRSRRLREGFSRLAYTVDRISTDTDELAKPDPWNGSRRQQV
jgi:hypothetical protein